MGIGSIINTLLLIDLAAVPGCQLRAELPLPQIEHYAHGVLEASIHGQSLPTSAFLAGKHPSLEIAVLL